MIKVGVWTLKHYNQTKVLKESINKSNHKLKLEPALALGFNYFMLWMNSEGI